MDTRSPRDGRVLEELGFYDPIAKEKEKQVKINAERVQWWLQKGAQTSDTVRDLLKKNGIAVKQ